MCLPFLKGPTALDYARRGTMDAAALREEVRKSTEKGNKDQARFYDAQLKAFENLKEINARFFGESKRLADAHAKAMLPPDAADIANKASKFTGLGRSTRESSFFGPTGMRGLLGRKP